MTRMQQDRMMVVGLLYILSIAVAFGAYLRISTGSIPVWAWVCFMLAVFGMGYFANRLDDSFIHEPEKRHRVSKSFLKCGFTFLCLGLFVVLKYPEGWALGVFGFCILLSGTSLYRRRLSS